MSASMTSGWQEISLGDCCTIVSGSTPSKAVERYWGGEELWATPKDLSLLDGNILEDTAVKLTSHGCQKCASSLLPKGSILFSSRAPIGLVAIAGTEMCTNQGFKSLIPGPKLDSSYLFWCMKRLAPRIADMGRGATFKEVSKSVMERIAVPVPPLKDQKRIAVILDKADAVRRKRQQTIALTEELLRSTFLEMFGDPALNPKGWRSKSIGSLADVVTGNTPPRTSTEYYGGILEWIKSDNLGNDRHHPTTAAETISAQGRSKARVVGPGATLVTCIAGSRDSIGNASITDREVAFNQQINALVPKEETNACFLYSQVLLAKRLIQAVSTNSMKGLVSKGRLEKIEFMCPPKALQLRFQEIFQCFLRVSEKERESSEASNSLFDSLSQRAFDGEI